MTAEHRSGGAAGRAARSAPAVWPWGRLSGCLRAGPAPPRPRSPVLPARTGRSGANGRHPSCVPAPRLRARRPRRAPQAPERRQGHPVRAPHKHGGRTILPRARVQRQPGADADDPAQHLVGTESGAAQGALLRRRRNLGRFGWHKRPRSGCTTGTGSTTSPDAAREVATAATVLDLVQCNRARRTRPDESAAVLHFNTRRASVRNWRTGGISRAVSPASVPPLLA